MRDKLRVFADRMKERKQNSFSFLCPLFFCKLYFKNNFNLILCLNLILKLSLKLDLKLNILDQKVNFQLLHV